MWFELECMTTEHIIVILKYIALMSHFIYAFLNEYGLHLKAIVT
jgi:hypothetical protein